MQSSLSKIIGILIAITVVGGGIAFWYFSHPTLPGQTGTQIQSGGLPDVLQTNTDGSSSQTGTQTQQPTISDTTSLFQKLGVQKVIFSPISANTTGTAAKIYTLYANDVAENKKFFPNDPNVSIDVSADDLNKDGTAEALVYEDLLSFCGSGGCSFDIYQLQNNKWIKLASLLAGQDIGIANTSTNGFSNLILLVPGDIASQTKAIQYVWDGTTYQPGATLATWNGTTFIVSQ